MIYDTRGEGLIIRRLQAAAKASQMAYSKGDGRMCDVNVGSGEC